MAKRSVIFRRASEGRIPEPSAIRIDGYRVEALLGRGQVTAVYRAVLESHQQVVALKVLLPWFSEQELVVQRFFQGANAARRITHDRLLSIYDVGQSHGWVYLACELVEGQTLGQLMGQGPLPRERLVHLAWQAAAGLEALHAGEIIHGNVRPGNLLLDAEDSLRLADAGLPTPPPDESSPHSRYFAPELFAETEASANDPRCDIYALGVICAEAVAGSAAWSSVTQRQILERQAAGGSILDLLPAGAVDPDLAAVLRRACAGNPADRYPFVWQLREDLERLHYRFAPIHASPLETAPTTQQPALTSGAAAAARAPRRRARWALAALTAVLALVGGLWWWSRGSPVAPPAPAASDSAASAGSPATTAAPVPADRPSWASASGRDAFGRWASVSVNGIAYRLRWIPAGSFWMGSPPDDPDRQPDEDHHLVTLTKAFWLGETEVPQGFWQAVMGSPSRSYFTGDELPVEKVSWNGAQEFLAKLGSITRAPFRLPTEAEWEYACRANDTVTGVPTTEVAWTSAASLDGTQPVGRLKPNAFGLYDMQGNVLEWVEDFYGRYGREPRTDPVLRQGVHRVTRGGSWNLKPAAARPAARSSSMIWNRR
ncbi:MAG: bifunctional serine/threonine-protein kinase/formylglycine-generating enzyme family protein [Burkholderiaceae bacterium]|nr:bifunctional serine/threonine-protein kinase/formylglycine-generating enzyme family protein [Burkholderiaceae bacterium]